MGGACDPDEIGAVVRQPGVSIDIEFEAFLDMGHDTDDEVSVLSGGLQKEHAEECTDGHFGHCDGSAIGIGPIEVVFGDEAEWAGHDGLLQIEILQYLSAN